jgi:cytochrome P450
LIEEELDVGFPTIRRYLRQPVVASNGAEHKVKRAYALRLVERDRLHGYEQMIVDASDWLIDAFIDVGECEFRSAFGDQLPLYAMLGVLGLPREDADLFQRDVRGLVSLPRQNEYMLRKISERLEDPGDDGLSALVRDQIDLDGGVDIEFQVMQAVNLIGAGSETTSHVLVSMMHVLCTHPNVMDAVRNDRSLIRPLAEETMRVETPLQWLPRVATDRAIVGGVAIPAGATVWLLWGSGNRDPEKFDRPDEFRLDRLPRAQLSFGRGPHFCAGAPLARLETFVAFDRLLTRLGNIRLVEEKSDLSNVTKDGPPRTEGILDPTGTIHAPMSLTIAFEKA